MATTLTQLLTEFYARGYDYLNDGGAGATRATAWANQSHAQLCARADFPWLYKDATGAAPLTITDLREVLSVKDQATGRPLQQEDRRTLETRYGLSFTQTGTPVYFFRDTANAISVVPPNTSVTLAVRYLKKPAALVNGSDTIVVPDEWADLVVDGMVIRGQKDDDVLGPLVTQYEQDVQRMIEAELGDGAMAEYVLDLGSDLVYP